MDSLPSTFISLACSLTFNSSSFIIDTNSIFLGFSGPLPSSFSITLSTHIPHSPHSSSQSSSQLPSQSSSSSSHMPPSQLSMHHSSSTPSQAFPHSFLRLRAFFSTQHSLFLCHQSSSSGMGDSPCTLLGIHLHLLSILNNHLCTNPCLRRRLHNHLRLPSCHLSSCHLSS